MLCVGLMYLTECVSSGLAGKALLKVPFLHAAPSSTEHRRDFFALALIPEDHYQSTAITASYTNHSDCSIKTIESNLCARKPRMLNKQAEDQDCSDASMVLLNSGSPVSLNFLAPLFQNQGWAEV